MSQRDHGIGTRSVRFQATQEHTEEPRSFVSRKRQPQQSHGLIDIDQLKHKIHQKIQDHNLKDQEQLICEFVSQDFENYLKNQLDKLIKLSNLESQQEMMLNQKKSTQTQNIILMQTEEQQKQLLQKKKGSQAENRKFLIGKQKMLDYECIKKIESMERADQEKAEELLMQKNLFDEYEGKKKVKKNDSEIDIYQILLKNKSEKTKEQDNLKRTNQDTSKAIDYYTGTDPVVEEKNSFIQSQNMEKNQNVLQKVTLKTLLFYLENDPSYRKSPFLIKSYLKSNLY